MKYRILVVEDIQLKATMIKSFLEESNYVVDVVMSGNEIERKLYESQYDIVLVDLVIPYNPGDPPDMENGLNVIKFIRRTNNIIFRPKNIIIMSEYVKKYNLFQELQERGFGYPIISFDENEINWKQHLLDQIEASINMAGRKADILIAVAVDVELDSVLKAGNWDTFLVKGDDIVYYTSQIMTKDKFKTSVILCKAKKMGPIGCASMVSKAICRFSPEYVFMIGIAAGNSKDTKCCDIVVASVSDDYSYGKIIENNNTIDFQGRSSSICIDNTIDQILDLYKANEKQELLNFVIRETESMAVNVLKPEELQHLKIIKSIDFKVGKVVSGPCVVTSDMFKQKYIINKNHSDYIALDMETYSLYYAAKHAASDSAKKFLSVKAISDMGDTDKKDIYQKLCVLESYNFIRYMISHDINIGC